jgi:putative sterol carrier protein
MAKYPFLSDEWVAEARVIYAQAEASGAMARDAAPVAVRVNLVVTEVPFSDTLIDAHVDTSAGRVAIDTGHLPEPDVTVSLDYATARSLFVSGDVQAALQAFLTGRIKVDGDLTKLLDPRSGIWPAGGMAGRPPTASAGPPSQPGLGTVAPEALDVAARLQAITE